MDYKAMCEKMATDVSNLVIGGERVPYTVDTRQTHLMKLAPDRKGKYDVFLKYALMPNPMFTGMLKGTTEEHTDFKLTIGYQDWTGKCRVRYCTPRSIFVGKDGISYTLVENAALSVKLGNGGSL